MSGVIQGSFGQRSGIIAENNMYRKPEDWQWKSTNIPNYDRPGESQYDVDGYTYSLIHAHPQNNFNDFLDVSCFGSNTVTGHGATKHDTGLGIMGPSGIAFDSNDDYLKIMQNKMFGGSSASITIDFWMATNDGGNSCLFEGRTSSYTSAIFIDHKNSTEMHFAANGNSHNFTVPGNTNDYKWHHVAVVRDTENSSGTGAKWYFFWDGISLTQTSGTSMAGDMTHKLFSGNTSHGILWGENYPSSAGYGGFLAEMRISIGIARWTSNFKVNKTTCKH